MFLRKVVFKPKELDDTEVKITYLSHLGKEEARRELLTVVYEVDLQRIEPFKLVIALGLGYGQGTSFLVHNLLFEKF